jgi:hypothetical protein
VGTVSYCRGNRDPDELYDQMVADRMDAEHAADPVAFAEKQRKQVEKAKAWLAFLDSGICVRCKQNPRVTGWLCDNCEANGE